MKDQRFALKVKIKSLAEEAKIIRKEEKKKYKDRDEYGHSETQTSLHHHRTGTVRSAARQTLLAYGFLRGRKYYQMEQKCEFPPDWKAVEKMVEKYGMPAVTWVSWWNTPRAEVEKMKEDLMKRFEDWKPEKQ